MHCLYRNCVRGVGSERLAGVLICYVFDWMGGKRGRAGRGKGFLMLGIECVGTASN